MNTTTPTKSLLTKKDRERLHWRAQVQKLQRIGNRAIKKADWLMELRGMYADDPDVCPSMDKVEALQDKAAAAAKEMVAIAKANGDPRVRGL